MDSDYFEYLKRRSLTGLLYRRYWLYPALSRNLSGRVLDIGCGLGDFLSYHPDAIGVDINANAVAWCRHKGLDAHMMEINRLPFDASAFESAVLDNVLEHLMSPDRLLREIHRILTPSGRLVIGVPGIRGFASDPDHKVFYDESRLDGVVITAGFRNVKFFYMPLRCAWLNTRLSQYCLYGVYARA